MEFKTETITTAAQAAWAEVSAFAVSYAFSILGAIILIIAGFIVANMVEKWVRRTLEHFRSFDATLTSFLSQVARYAVLVLVGVTVLAQFGVQTASIIAALGAASIAIGLALQGTLQNVAAGIMLLVLKPFRVGEFVEASGISGTIQAIGLFATEMKTVDGLYILAPNSSLWNTSVTNYSRNSRRRNDLVIGIGYGDDIDLAQQTMMDLAAADERILKDQEPVTYVSELGDSAVAVTLRYWTSTADWWQTRLDMTKAAKQAFDEKGISIPFPQRDVHYLPLDSKKPASGGATKALAKG
ncbi:mechanosensitive ion channel [Nitratireductor aquimarinus]|uniref:mechanosensitive ion channel family protein n=1 Tax=Nitratireductor aquimarinus TaxID=889300 RepID=UPI001A8E3164|nr:mechanosensitive ion channel domain-containing protein [Nitratireductor aquimarinus]MBN8241827.1 mechanosensitive ion channel [Nitratireductor aquimarinus]MBY6130213.1 mechanosensitive ion channel [Nitratireductor aquimarinus]MCA1304341.1 mechanosensitive ion channel [Nitratireductor aquimarinus]